MVVFPDLSVKVLDELYSETIDELICQANDNGQETIDLSMRVCDAETLKWLISSFRVARTCVDISERDMFNMDANPEHILYQAQDEIVNKFVRYLVDEGLIKFFHTDDGRSLTHRIEARMCTVRFPKIEESCNENPTPGN